MTDLCTWLASTVPRRRAKSLSTCWRGSQVSKFCAWNENTTVPQVLEKRWPHDAQELRGWPVSRRRFEFTRPSGWLRSKVARKSFQTQDRDRKLLCPVAGDWKRERGPHAPARASARTTAKGHNLLIKARMVLSGGGRKRRLTLVRRAVRHGWATGDFGASRPALYGWREINLQIFLRSLEIERNRRGRGALLFFFSFFDPLVEPLRKKLARNWVRRRDAQWKRDPPGRAVRRKKPDSRAWVRFVGKGSGGDGVC